MLRRIKGLLPHAAILICNMYIVFYLIDRVNKAMNFIDNGLTKGLLLVLCLIALYNARRLSRIYLRRNRPGAAALPLLSGVMCAILLLLLPGDLIWPGVNLFLNEAVKLFLLATCVASAVCGIMLYARQRKRKRRKKRTAQSTGKPMPVWLVCLAHVLALGVALLLYALPHHVIPRSEEAVGVVSSRDGMTAACFGPAEVFADVSTQAPAEATPTVDAGEPEAAPPQAAATEATPAEDVEPAPEGETEPEQGPEPVGSFRRAFADKFTSGEVEQGDGYYRSRNVNVTLDRRFADEMHAQVYVADIYIADIYCLQTAFAKNTYGRGYREWITDVATRYKSVVTLNGDYYGCRDTGIVIRNGRLYRDKKYQGDILALYWDGHMEAFKSTDFDAMAEMNRGICQGWSFGPSLLEADGSPKSKFNCDSNLQKRNPRSAIGYYEPGHYCFVVVDGRNNASNGASMAHLAQLMSSLGCKLAYNLDGGQTSLLAAGSKLINKPSQGGRSSSDYIMIIDINNLT